MSASIASIMALVSALSPAEKLQLNVQFAASMVEKTKSTRKGKPASLGTRAWTAFVAHVQETMPERFAPPAMPKERLTIAGAIRLENPAGYAEFCAKFKEEHPVASESEPETEAADSQASEPVAAAAEPVAAAAAAEPVAAATAAEKAEKPKRVISEAQKAAMKAGREKAKAAKDAAAAAAAAAPAPAANA
jgi:hypothetical protein